METVNSISRLVAIKCARILTLFVITAISAALISGLLFGVGGGLAQLRGGFGFADTKLGEIKPLDVRSQVFDRYGNVIATWRGEQNRVPIPLSDVPPALVQTLLDIEDSQFYRHMGLNLRSFVRATAANVEAGGVAQGGSTLTQQLVKLSFLTSKQDVNRKVREALISYRFEKKFTKEQILGMYLNTIYFGEGSYGVQAAAERYFAKNAKDLDVGECAFLVGMIRNPVGYDPIKFRDRSRSRRSVVLQRVLALGHITPDQFATYNNAPMPRPKDRLVKPETYFLEAVKQELLDDPRLGDTAKERYNAVFSGGLQIVTTFDPDAQRRAESAVTRNIGAYKDFSAALVSVDVGSGAVRALVGGRGFDTDKYNLATQGKRQPGSSWKPFTLIAALESGVSSKSTISGEEPCPIPNPNGKPNPYLPHNSSEGAGTTDSILAQLVRSNNCAYSRLAFIVGYDKVAAVAKRLGITTKIDLVPAMALGVEEVRPIDMAGAYATIAAEGILRTPYLVESVMDRNGKVIFTANPGNRRVVDQQVARTVTGALRRVVTSGTATAADLNDRQVAGKTGTTNDYEDAWFVGFTPQLATAVWMGAPDRKLSMRSVGGVKVMGGTYPAEIWHDYTRAELADQPAIALSGPDPALFGQGTCLSIDAKVAQMKEKARLDAKAKRDADRAAKAAERAAKVAASSLAAASPTTASSVPANLAAGSPTVNPNLSFPQLRKPTVGRGFSVVAPIGSAAMARRGGQVTVDTQPSSDAPLGSKSKRKRFSGCSVSFDWETTMKASASSVGSVDASSSSGDSSKSSSLKTSKRRRKTTTRVTVRNSRTSGTVFQASPQQRVEMIDQSNNQSDRAPSPTPEPVPAVSPAPNPAPAPNPSPAAVDVRPPAT